MTNPEPMYPIEDDGVLCGVIRDERDSRGRITTVAYKVERMTAKELTERTRKSTDNSIKKKGEESAVGSIGISIPRPIFNAGNPVL